MSDDSICRINNRMIAPIHDDQMEIVLVQYMYSHPRHRQRRRRIGNFFGGVIGMCVFCSLVLLSTLQSSISVASSPSIYSTKTTALSTGREKQKKRKRQSVNNPFRKDRTIVTGFGSRSIKKTIFAYRSSKRPMLKIHKRENEQNRVADEGDEGTHDEGTDIEFLPAFETPKMWVQRPKYDDKSQEDDDLWILIRDDKNEHNENDRSSFAQDRKSHIVLKLSFADELDDWVVERVTSKEESEFIRNHPLDEWIPVDGLYGVYRVPSGVLWILITGTEGIYEAPPIAASTSSKPSSWWQIRRVTNLEIVHLGKKGYNQSETITLNSKPLSTMLTASELREEVRQLRLLRKALKQHDFYYVPEGGAQSNQVVRDMTKTIQRSILESDNIESKRGSSNNNKWWNDDDNADGKIPDPRFFWNQHAAEPILRRYQNKKEENPMLSTVSRTIDNQQRQKQLAGVLLHHVVPLTSAFVGVQTNLTVTENNEASKANLIPISYDEILISRRSRFRAGTRFTVRGADASGNCANFAETEQICLTTTVLQDPCSSKSKKKKRKECNSDKNRWLQSIASHVQTRGSIPLRWSSPADIKTYRPRVNIGADPLAQARAVRLHILDQLSHYTIKYTRDDVESNSCPQGPSCNLSDIVFVNLVDKHSDQGRLGRAFDAVLNAVVDVHGNESRVRDTTEVTLSNSSCIGSPPWVNSSKLCGTIGRNSVKHIWYDFHAEVKNGRWNRLGLLLDEVKSLLIGHGYFSALAPSRSRHENDSSHQNNRWSIERLQRAVVRTNCMDCLDRTNVVQSIFGRYMLFQQLSDHTKDATAKNKQWTHMEKIFEKEPMKLPWDGGEVAHRLLWADNADAISRLYAGTPALKGDFTRTGKRTKRGALDDGMNSLQRYYLNNFLDADRQEGYDLLVGHTMFSNVVEEVPFQHYDTESTSPYNPSLSFLGATRQSILSDLVKGSSFQHRRDVRRRLAEIGVSKQPDLDLRWLPGDLQTQLRDQTSDALTSSVNELRKDAENPKKDEGKFCSQQALKAIDERSHLDFPWWSASDGDWLVVDEKGENRPASVLGMNEHRSQVVLTPTQLAFVFYLGFKAPSLLIGLTTFILGFVYFPECIKHDYRKRKSLDSLIREFEYRKLITTKRIKRNN